MSQNVNYLFTNETPDGALVFRSTINSFGLDHVTDKNLCSFYTEFSRSAYFDSGLLPVEGSGVLSIRSALNHTQVAYQHAPGKYYINWGAYEGQSEVNKFLVAQPYRIVIIDFLNGNIYGARTFYSPVPITYSHAPLYHVNLPNINCKGYQGNAVGWICLYHTTDVSSYPFNEKLHVALERCSGVETYNDANMSETDGTRFYATNRSDHRYLWDPSEWERKTEQDGVDWTLNPDLWIPVLVHSRDSQDKHDPYGLPLTLADALIGKYKAYYTDELVPKPVNAIARPDLELDQLQLFNLFKVAYINANSSTVPFTGIDVFSISQKIKQDTAELIIPVTSTSNENEEDTGVITTFCFECGTDFEHTEWDVHDDLIWIEHLSNYACHHCVSSLYVYDPDSCEYYHPNSSYGKELMTAMVHTYPFCFYNGTTCDPSTPSSVSFTTKVVNDSSFNEDLQLVKKFHSNSFANDDFFVSLPLHLFSYDEYVKYCNSHEIPSYHFGPNAQAKYSDFIEDSSSKLKIYFHTMCSHCAQHMFSSSEYFSHGCSLLIATLQKALTELKEQEGLSVISNQILSTLFTSPFIGLAMVNS